MAIEEPAHGRASTTKSHPRAKERARARERARESILADFDGYGGPDFLARRGFWQILGTSNQLPI